MTRIVALLACTAFFTVCKTDRHSVETHDKSVTNLDTSFVWPNDFSAAVSLTFDDARFSQIDTGIPLLDSFNVKASFYVSIWSAEQRLNGWQKAHTDGHEIGNHSWHHPCSINFDWRRPYFLENMTLDDIQEELRHANDLISEKLQLPIPGTFAYPCGQKFVGKGTSTKSYVPVAADLFKAARGWNDEAPNHPALCDMSQLMAISSDNKSYAEIVELIKKTKEQGGWLILAGHEVGIAGTQTTSVAMLRQLLAYLNDPASRLWVAPLGTIADYVISQRED